MAPDDTSVDTGNENSKYKDGVNRNARLIVRNVSFKATEELLREHFVQYGSVEEVKLLRKPDGKLVGCGFVHFTEVPMANKALAATNKKPFLGRPLNVAWAVPKHKYNEELQSNDKVRIKSELFEENGKVTIKKEITEDEIVDKNKSKARVNRNARLIIRNISFKASEESLQKHFEPYGTIHEVKLLRKPDGKLVGCAFVHFKNVPMAKKALLNTNMKPFLGRPISVDWAVAKNKYMQHIVNQEIDMQEKVKKEESDSDDDADASNHDRMNLDSSDVKKEEANSDKDESDESSDESKTEDGSDSEDDDNDNEINGSESDDGSDNHSRISTQVNHERIRLNDAEDGCTVFITNIPFSIDNDQLKQFVERTAPVKYALICVDKLTEHSKGTGFVKFLNKEDAERFLSLPNEQLLLEGQIVKVRPALRRENLQRAHKQPKDNRNLYLVKEGVIAAGTNAACGVSASDMAKRLTLERSKTTMLRDLNRFVSRRRLVVGNLPPRYDDAALRRLCTSAAPRRAIITEARVMRLLRSPPLPDGTYPSKGYGFVTFTEHEDALACLRKLNNNPEVFDKNNRPIVSFAIEDRAALNARKKRLEKSILNNPLANKKAVEVETKKDNRKRRQTPCDGNFGKRRKFERSGRKEKVEFSSGGDGKFVRRPHDDRNEAYTGLTAAPGTKHYARSGQKLKAQASVHMQQVKFDKKKSLRAKRLKMSTRERIKLPRLKINKNKKKA